MHTRLAAGHGVGGAIEGGCTAAILPTQSWSDVACHNPRAAGLDGTHWGTAVREERGKTPCWRLESGRIAKMKTEGKVWRWRAA